MPEMLRSPEAQARSARRLQEEREWQKRRLISETEIPVLRISEILDKSQMLDDCVALVTDRSNRPLHYISSSRCALVASVTSSDGPQADLLPRVGERARRSRAGEIWVVWCRNLANLKN